MNEPKYQTPMLSRAEWLALGFCVAYTGSVASQMGLTAFSSALMVLQKKVFGQSWDTAIKVLLSEEKQK